MKDTDLARQGRVPFSGSLRILLVNFSFVGRLESWHFPHVAGGNWIQILIGCK
jgi:hypothetical protein